MWFLWAEKKRSGLRLLVLPVVWWCLLLVSVGFVVVLLASS